MRTLLIDASELCCLKERLIRPKPVPELHERTMWLVEHLLHDRFHPIQSSARAIRLCATWTAIVNEFQRARLLILDRRMGATLYSRDDIGGFMPDYLDHGLLPVDPFQVLDEFFSGEMIRFPVSDSRSLDPAEALEYCTETQAQAEAAGCGGLHEQFHRCIAHPEQYCPREQLAFQACIAGEHFLPRFGSHAVRLRP